MNIVSEVRIYLADMLNCDIITMKEYDRSFDWVTENPGEVEFLFHEKNMTYNDIARYAAGLE